MTYEAFAVISEDTLAVLLDLPPELVVDRVETTVLLQSNGARRKVHLFHFRSERPAWRNEIDLMYHIKPSDSATQLHSIGYSSSNLEEGQDAEEDQDARRAGSRP